MKKIFYVLIGILFTSCGVPKESIPEPVSLSTPEEKIIQVKELLAPLPEVKQEIILSSTWARGEENTKTPMLQSPIESQQISEQKPIEETSISQISLPNDSTGQTITQEPFTQEEIEIIENTTDAEIDELIDIIFSE